MVNFNAEPPPNVVRVPRWTLALHAIQFVFATVILGLDAYGISYIAYNALIFSLVVCLCTFGVTVYLVASQLFIHKLYNAYIALAFHIWMLLFWVIDLGLVANLASIWANPICSSYYGYSYSCSYYRKRDVEIRGFEKRDTTSYTAYYGALAAGAVFAAVQLVTWALSAVILIIHFNKHRTNAANTTTHVSHPPPQYANTPHNNNIPQPVPMEKYSHQASTHQTPQPQYAQPVQGHQQNFSPPYAQDPVQRQDTVSPVSQAAGYAAPPPNHNTSELSSPQHTGVGYAAPPPNANASELSSPQHTGTGGPVYNHNVSELSTTR
jgi:hypothetical protein